jgi:hypothetical protein
MDPKKKSGKSVSRVLLPTRGIRPERAGNHSSRIAIARDLKRSTRTKTPRAAARPVSQTRSAGSCSRWGLPSSEGHPPLWWALTPPFHPYWPAETVQRSTLCCTFPNLAAGRRYRPSRPAEPGLSSDALRSPVASAIARPPAREKV